MGNISDFILSRPVCGDWFEGISDLLVQGYYEVEEILLSRQDYDYLLKGLGEERRYSAPTPHIGYHSVQWMTRNGRIKVGVHTNLASDVVVAKCARHGLSAEIAFHGSGENIKVPVHSVMIDEDRIDLFKELQSIN